MSGTKDPAEASLWVRMLVPLASGLAVLMLGYVALRLFWKFGDYPAGVPGLFYYHAATWGDGLLLPVLAFCLWALIGQLDRAPRSWPTWIAYGLGALAGALLIFTWWRDPHPSPNWTLPRPHDFTLPGKWHAGFLIAASAFFAGSWVELFRRIRSSSKAKAALALASPLTAGALGCTAAYAWLAASGSASASHTASGLGSLAALAASAAALIACLTWAARGAWAEVARSVIAGMLLAAALVMFTETYGKTGSFMLFAAVIGALGAGVALAGEPGHGKRYLQLEMVAVPALYAALVLVAAHTTKLVVVVVAPISAIIISAILRCVYNGGDQPQRAWRSINYLAGSGISACLLGAGAFGLWLSAQKADAYITAGFLLTIIGAILGGVFLPYYRTDYVRLMQIEGDPTIRQPDGRPSSGQHQAAVEAWLRLGGYAVSATASMLVLTVALAPSLGWRAGAAHIPWRYPLGIALIGLVLTLLTAGALVQSMRRHPADGPLNAPRGRGGIYALASFLEGAAVSVLGAILLIRDGELNGLALAQTALLTAFTVLTLVDTGALLHTRRVNPRAWPVIVSNSSAIFVVVYWSLTDAVRPGGSPSTVGASLAALLCSAVFVALLMDTASCTTYVTGEQPYRTDYSPFSGITQDWFLMTCMWFLLAWTPQVVLTHIPDGTHERWSAIGTILAGFLLLFGPAYLWILENNDTHVERQRTVRKVKADGALADLARATSSADRIRTLPGRIKAFVLSIYRSRENRDPELTQYEFMVRLSGHTAAQNAISMVLAIFTVIGIVGMSSGLAPTAIGATGLVGEESPQLRQEQQIL
jgi:hypothetical protein